MKKYELIERTNGSVSPAQMKNRNESNTELTCDHAIFNGNAKDRMRLFGCPKCGGVGVLSDWYKDDEATAEEIVEICKEVRKKRAAKSKEESMTEENGEKL